MTSVTPAFEPNFTSWRAAAVKLLAAGIPPGNVRWIAEPDMELFAPGTAPVAARSATIAAPVAPAFRTLARRVACHADPSRWALLYRLAWRMSHGEPHLLDVVTDDDVWRAVQMEKAVRREVHKMHAFVRFREVTGSSVADVCYVAWFEPAHPVVEAATPFFARRFATMQWSILTPWRCAHWDGNALAFTPGADAPRDGSDDAIESLWITYYVNIFNPARVKVSAMKTEMPKRYWKNLPEATLIPGMVAAAPGRVATMIDRSR